MSHLSVGFHDRRHHFLELLLQALTLPLLGRWTLGVAVVVQSEMTLFQEDVTLTL